MAIELVTGYAGQGHVSSADAGRFNAGICGSGKYVLNTGLKFAYTKESNTLIRIGSGDAIDQGRHIIIPQNTVEEVTIQNGAQGRTRIDVIALRYEKDPDTGIETASVVAIRGTDVASTATPTVPALTSGNIFNGASADEMALYHVLITDMAIQSVTPVFSELPSLMGMLDSVYPIGAIYISVSNTSPSVLFGGTWEEIQGRFLLGRSSDHAAGSTGGEETHTLTAAEMPAHTHNGPSHTHNGPSHTHTGPSHTHSIPAHTHSTPNHTHTGTAASAGAHSHAMYRSQLAGPGSSRYAAHKVDGDNSRHYTTTDGAHTHTVTITSGGGGTTGSGGSGTSGAAGTGATGAAGTGATSAAGTGATSSTGGSGAHNNMPPYLAVYMWQRTA